MQPMSMVLPGVVGFKLSGKLPNGVTATDLVLTVTQILRKHGVVGKFVEFYGNFSCCAHYQLLLFVWLLCGTHQLVQVPTRLCDVILLEFSSYFSEFFF